MVLGRHLGLFQAAVQLISSQSNDSLLSLGRHYWYNISKDMDCKDFYPMFLLYNKKGRLTGFGWVSMGRAESSRYEHPPPNRLNVSIRIKAHVLNCARQARFWNGYNCAPINWMRLKS